MDISKKIFSIIKIIRPLNIVITFGVVTVTIILLSNQQFDLKTALLASLAASLTAAAGNIINDIFDIETDKISHPNRVLVKGFISRREAWALYFSLNIVSVIIALYLSLTLFIVVLSAIFLLYIYSVSLKRLPLIGNITISFTTGLAFIYGGLAADNPVGAVIPAVFAFLINLIRELVKDIQDIDGDSKQNFKTFPIKQGIGNTKNLILFVTILLILLTCYPFIAKLYMIEYFLIVMIFVNPILVLSMKMLFDKNKELRLNHISNLLKLNMIIGLIAIWFGK